MCTIIELMTKNHHKFIGSWWLFCKRMQNSLVLSNFLVISTVHPNCIHRTMKPRVAFKMGSTSNAKISGFSSNISKNQNTK